MWQQGVPIFQFVHLVDRQNDRAFHPLQLLQNHVVGRRPGQLVDHEHHHINIDQRRVGSFVHVAVECTGLVFVHARGIDVDRLDRAVGFDAQYLVARGLRFAGSNTELLAKNMVEQCRLAHIGPTDDRHEATAAVRVVRTGNIVHQEFSTPSSFRAFLAACCSATRRLLPVPVVLRSSDGRAQET